MVRIAVLVTPRAGTDRIDGVDAEGVLRVKVRAAPADGAANEALLGLMAETLGVPRSAVSLERGAAARRKLVVVDESARQRVAALWPTLPAVGPG
jgi:uncharacterized protein